MYFFILNFKLKMNCCLFGCIIVVLSSNVDCNPAIDYYSIQREVQILKVTNCYGQTQILPYFALPWVLILSIEYAITRMGIEILEKNIRLKEKEDFEQVTECLEKANKETER